MRKIEFVKNPNIPLSCPTTETNYQGKDMSKEWCFHRYSLGVVQWCIWRWVMPYPASKRLSFYHPEEVS